MQTELETRFTTAEVRAASSRVLTGMAIRFGKKNLSQDLGGYFEFIRNYESVADSLKENRIFSYWMHNREKPMGVTDAGNLILRGESEGLRFENNVPRVSWGDDVLKLVETNTIRHMSFGFFPVDELFTEDKLTGRWVSEMVKIDLREISYVDVPAYSQTFVNLRRLERANFETPTERIRFKEHLEEKNHLHKLNRRENELAAKKFARRNYR